MNSSKAIKSFILSVLLILSAALFWKGLADIYLHKNLLAGSLIWFGVSLFIFIVLFLFFSLLVDYRGTFFIIYAFSLLTFFIFFSASKADPRLPVAVGQAPQADNYYFFVSISLIVLFGAMIVSRVLMQKERKERLKVSVRAVFRNGLVWFVTFLALFIAFVGYIHPLVPTDKDEINLPPEILNLFVKPLTGTLSRVLPMIDQATTIDQAISMNIVTQNINLISFSPELLDKLKDKNIKDLNPAELIKDPEIAEIWKKEVKKQAEKIDSQALIEQKDNLAKTLGIELTGKETISEAINKAINAKIRDALGPAISFLPIVSVVITFVALRILFIPLGWVIILFSLIVFQFLIAFKFIRREKVMKEGEDVSI